MGTVRLSCARSMHLYPTSSREMATGWGAPLEIILPSPRTWRIRKQPATLGSLMMFLLFCRPFSGLWFCHTQVCVITVQ